MVSVTYHGNTLCVLYKMSSQVVMVYSIAVLLKEFMSVLYISTVCVCDFNDIACLHDAGWGAACVI